VQGIAEQDEHGHRCPGPLSAAVGVVPAREAHSVVSGEHAWDVRNAAIRAQWGFDAEIT
jgi:hypothetical protein